LRGENLRGLCNKESWVPFYYNSSVKHLKCQNCYRNT